MTQRNVGECFCCGVAFVDDVGEKMAKCEPELGPENQSTKLTVVEKVEEARRYKKEGNELYKENRPKKALGKYHRCLLYIKAVEAQKTMLPFTLETEEALPVELRDEVTRLKVDCYNNLAACLLQMPRCDNNKVITYCDLALAVNPGNVKAQYRKAVAHYNLGHYDVASEMLTNAGGLLKHSDANINKYLELCAQKEEQYNKECKKMYRKIFS